MFEKPITTNLKNNEYGCRVHAVDRPSIKGAPVGSSAETRVKQGALNIRTGKETVRTTQNYKNYKAKLIEDGKNRWKK
ncbi:MAG: hypothetical protein NZ702_04205 [Gammaproteobacteria bacterium]|nr:hypothetical protein [Gammaproteobacteria bacterium]